MPSADTFWMNVPALWPNRTVKFLWTAWTAARRACRIHKRWPIPTIGHCLVIPFINSSKKQTWKNYQLQQWKKLPAASPNFASGFAIMNTKPAWHSAIRGKTAKPPVGIASIVVAMGLARQHHSKAIYILSSKNENWKDYQKMKWSRLWAVLPHPAIGNAWGNVVYVCNMATLLHNVMMNGTVATIWNAMRKYNTNICMILFCSPSICLSGATKYLAIFSVIRPTSFPLFRNKSILYTNGKQNHPFGMDFSTFK